MNTTGDHAMVNAQQQTGTTRHDRRRHSTEPAHGGLDGLSGPYPLATPCSARHDAISGPLGPLARRRWTSLLWHGRMRCPRPWGTHAAPTYRVCRCGAMWRLTCIAHLGWIYVPCEVPVGDVAGEVVR